MPMTNRHITGVDGCGKGDGEETVFGALSVPSSGVFRAMRRRAYDKCDEQTVEMITRYLFWYSRVRRSLVDSISRSPPALVRGRLAEMKEVSFARIEGIADVLAILAMASVLLLPIWQDKTISGYYVGFQFGAGAFIVSLLPIFLSFVRGGPGLVREYVTQYRSSNGLSWPVIFLLVELPFIVLGAYCASFVF